MEYIDNFRNNLNRLIDIEKVLKKRRVTIKKMAADCRIDYKQLISFRKNKDGKGQPLGEGNKREIAKYLGVPYSEMCGEIHVRGSTHPAKDQMGEMLNLMRQLVLVCNEVRREIKLQTDKLDPMEEDIAWLKDRHQHLLNSTGSLAVGKKPKTKTG